MLWLRGAIFTILIPAVIAGWVPQSMLRGRSPAGGAWLAGGVLAGAGAALYLSCLLRFLLAGGTPAIFFTRPLRFLIGEAPRAVVRAGPYRFSRNPMYLGVTSAIFGQAILYRSAVVAVYGAVVWLCFHSIVVYIEEPHLESTRGADYKEYLRRVPRWLGRPR